MGQLDTQDKHSNRALGGEWLFFLFESLVVIAICVTTIRGDSRLWAPPRLVLITVVIAVHLILLWLSAFLFSKHPRLWIIYFIVQVGLAVGISLLTPGTWLGITLYMGLTGMAIALFWPNLGMVVAAILLCFILSSFNLILFWGWKDFLHSVPALGGSLTFVVIYVALFARQIEAREQAQDLLHELEQAHSQLQVYANRVEELTISQERQRMAQELHDTLAQGLAGLILQLDAADSHLEGKNIVKAQEIVQRAMARARMTLREARRAIQALRPAVLEQGSLIDALGHEVDEFSAMTGIEATFQVLAGPPDVLPTEAQEILRIVQESLTNAARHSRAEHVVVRLETLDGRLHVEVEDDGCGFDLEQVAGQAGSFGLRGLEERAEHLGGKIQIHSAPGKGTTVTLEMRIGNGEVL